MRSVTCLGFDAAPHVPALSLAHWPSSEEEIASLAADQERDAVAEEIRELERQTEFEMEAESDRLSEVAAFLKQEG